MSKAYLGYQRDVNNYYKEGRSWLLSNVTGGQARKKLHYSLERKFKSGFQKTCFLKNSSNGEILEKDTQNAISINQSFKEQIRQVSAKNLLWCKIWIDDLLMSLLALHFLGLLIIRIWYFKF